MILDIEPIKKREQAATPGPWTFIPEKGTNKGGIQPVCYFGDDITYYPNAGYIYEEADGEFMAHARTDIPALLDELERTREAAKELRSSLRFYTMPPEEYFSAPELVAKDALRKTQWLEDLK